MTKSNYYRAYCIHEGQPYLVVGLSLSTVEEGVAPEPIVMLEDYESRTSHLYLPLKSVTLINEYDLVKFQAKMFFLRRTKD